MKMNIFPFENEIVFNDKDINVIEVENKKLFANIVNGISNKINNIPIDEKIILLDDNGNNIEFDKDVMFILDIFNIDLNKTKMLNKLYKKIEGDILLDEETHMQIINSLQKIKIAIEDIYSEYSLEVYSESEYDLQECIKLLNIRINESKNNKPIEKIYSLIDMAEMFDLSKLIIFVNLKTYFDDKQIVDIYKYSKYMKVNIVLIEQKQSITNLKYERKMVIDDDFCDIII